MFSLSNNKGGLLGIDISSSAVKLIELSRKGDDYRVDSYAVASLPEGVTSERDINEAEKVGEAIKLVVKNSRTKSRRCALGIPSSMAINKIITIPASIPGTELEAQISLEAEQYIPYPMDEVNFDYEVLGPSDTSSEMIDVLIAGTRTENVEVRLAAAEMAGLDVEIVDLESHAVELLFRTMIDDMEKHDVVAAVDFGASMTGINVFENSKVVFSREQVFGGKQLTQEISQRYGLSYPEAGLAKKNGNLPEGYTLHSIEPNGGNEKPILQELYRVARKFLILLERIWLDRYSASYSFIMHQHKKIKLIRFYCRVVVHQFQALMSKFKKPLGFQRH